MDQWRDYAGDLFTVVMEGLGIGSGKTDMPPIKAEIGPSSPFLKWAGGKRWMIAARLIPMPLSFKRYIEPFLGGGAIFFSLKPKEALLSDINSDLINLYRAIQANPDEFEKIMKRHQKRHNKDYYYRVRAEVPEGLEERAARTLYLNRTCWNGLYRVNLRGEFNVPIGTKNTVIFPGEDFGEISRILRSAKIRCSDFEKIVDAADKDDFVFIDPPYTVQHYENGFIKYNEHIFSWADQIRLRDSVRRAIVRGAFVVVTNADHESIRSLYSGICNYRQLSRYSVLAGDSNYRGRTTEAMFIGGLSHW